MRSKVFMIGAVGYGALLGWAFTADHYEKKLERKTELLNALVARQANQLNRMQNEKVRAEMVPSRLELEGAVLSGGEIDQVDGTEVETEKSPEGETEGTDDSDDADEDDLSEEIPHETTEETRTRLQKIIDSYTSDPDNSGHFVEAVSRDIEQTAKHTPPFVISREKFSWDEEEGDNYAKITLKWYPRQRLLLDELEDPIKDVRGHIGWESLNQFGGESGDPNVVYVRNRRLETDFEVVLEEDDPPLHTQYAMPKEEFESQRAAGILRLRPEHE